jgi:hypothetical protein
MPKTSTLTFYGLLAIIAAVVVVLLVGRLMDLTVAPIAT